MISRATPVPPTSSATISTSGCVTTSRQSVVCITRAERLREAFGLHRAAAHRRHLRRNPSFSAICSAFSARMASVPEPTLPRPTMPTFTCRIWGYYSTLEFGWESNIVKSSTTFRFCTLICAALYTGRLGTAAIIVSTFSGTPPGYVNDAYQASRFTVTWSSRSSSQRKRLGNVVHCAGRIGLLSERDQRAPVLKYRNIVSRFYDRFSRCQRRAGNAVGVDSTLGFLAHAGHLYGRFSASPPPDKRNDLLAGAFRAQCRRNRRLECGSGPSVGDCGGACRRKALYRWLIAALVRNHSDAGRVLGLGNSHDPAVPETATADLLGMGLLACAGFTRRAKCQASF